MSRKAIHVTVLAVSFSTSAGAHADPTSIEPLDSYRQQGIGQFDAERGRQLWYASVNERGCTNCHDEKPAKVGQHVKTGKPIEPMAPSVNPARYQNARKIEKWFLRNCKWTLGRECNLQEKADILSWLASQ
ncbi:MAG TPA: DUF1924 domain-containing protein [Gammaproteobacteria bacterium]|nr:DUF1924 domain-containing protein [Gammaproteobacteria bacterium]